MKFGIISDIHFHTWKPFSNGFSRLHTVGDVVLQACNIAIAHRCELMLNTGDLFHDRKSLTIPTLQYTFKTMTQACNIIGWISLKGNHDLFDKLGEYSSLSIFEEIDGFSMAVEEDEEYGVFLFDDVALFALDWQDSPQKFREVMKKICTEAGNLTHKHKILICHTEPKGSSTPAGYEFHDGMDLSAAEEIFNHIFIGHVHKPQRLGKITIPGCPYHQDTGDIGDEKGFWIYDTEVGEPEFHKLDYPEFRYIMDIKDFDENHFCKLITNNQKLESHHPNLLIVKTKEDVVKERIRIKSTDNNMTIIKDYLDTYNGDLDKNKLWQEGKKLI